LQDAVAVDVLVTDQSNPAPRGDPPRQFLDGDVGEVCENLVLDKHGIGRRGQIKHQDEQQRPEDGFARFAHTGRRVVAHQQVRQRRRTHRQTEDQREKVDPL